MGVSGQHHALVAVTQGKRAGTHCVGGRLGPRAGLDGCRKSRPHRDSIPRLSSLQRVTIYIGCPTRYRTQHFFNNFTTNEDIATTTDTHYRHIPVHFSHNERTPVQISLQCLHWCRNARFGSEWDTLYILLIYTNTVLTL